MIRKIVLATVVILLGVFLLAPISSVNAGVDCGPSDCPDLNPGCCNDPPPGQDPGCTGANSCGVGECCIGGSCESQASGACDGGGGSCGAGEILNCGSISADACMAVSYRQSCGDIFPTRFTGECSPYAGNCQKNCSCCPSGQVRACSGSTYNTAPINYYFENKPNFGYLHRCDASNDEWLSSTETRDSVTMEFTQYTTCRACGCVPVNADPIGGHNDSSCTLSWGWTCDPDNYSQPIDVHFYKDGLSGVAGYLGAVTADQMREAAVGTQCGGNSAHGFIFATPDFLIDGQPHSISTYAINTPVGNNPLLWGSPKTFTCTPTCDGVPLSVVAPFPVGSTNIPITSDAVTNPKGIVSNVTFTSSNTNIVTVSPPASDSSPQYLAQLNGISAGTATITANAIMSGASRCIGTRQVTVTALNTTPWWQVKDGDVTTNENITSQVPTNKYFETAGNGGFAGVPVFGTSFNLITASTPSKISVPKWNVNSTTTQPRLFDYSYFKNLIPDDVVSGQTYSDGYKWTIVSGDYTLPATSIGNNKVIYFIDGNLTVNGNITLNDNIGFLGVFVSGTININSSVTNIEGVYLSDSGFSTGLGTSQLQIRGSVISHGGISLQRDLVDDTNPAEIFEFAPDQIALFPEKLGFRGQKWSEVAP